jgi:hypothetical protein
MFSIIPDIETTLLNTHIPVSESFYYNPSSVNEFIIFILKHL